MATTVKSAEGNRSHRGFRMNVQRPESRRMKFSDIQGPSGTEVTDEMLNGALAALHKQHGIEVVSLNQHNEFVVTAKRVRPAWKAVQQFDQLAERLWRLIIDSMIKVAKRQKRKVRQAKAAQRPKPATYVNDKTKTVPAAVPVT